MPGALLVVEDDEDVQLLVESAFSKDARFAFAGATTSAEGALQMSPRSRPLLIVLDQGLAGELSGLEAAPKLKEAFPSAKIILFTAHAELRGTAANEPAVDAFLLKTDSARLLPMAQQLLGLSGAS